MNLKNVNHINQLRRLGLPLNEILIVGSGTMALLGIKKNDDLDMWVTERVFRNMKNNKKLKPVMKHGRLFYETSDGNIECSNIMPCTKGKVEDYLKRAIIVYGFHFKSVNDVIAWKRCMGRPKDKRHIKMLEDYLKNRVIENHLKTLDMLR